MSFSFVASVCIVVVGGRLCCVLNGLCVCRESSVNWIVCECVWFVVCVVWYEFVCSLLCVRMLACFILCGCCDITCALKGSGVYCVHVVGVYE